MKIIRFDGNLIDEPELSYKSQDTPLGRLVENVIHAAAAIHDADIEVVLIDNPELFDFWNAPENSLGFHAMNSGAFEFVDNDVLSTVHRVVVMVDEQYLTDYIAEEIQKDWSDHRANYVADYLVTVTHELAHCMEFIENSNGLTPSEAQNLYECDELQYSLRDLVTGHGILFDYDENYTPDELTEIMESRVEEKGRVWLNECQMDQQLFDAVVEHYTQCGLSMS